MKKDISYAIENDRFNFRVGAYIVHDNKVLLKTAPEIDFYNLPGGRVKMGENTLQAIKRELDEELELKVNDDDLSLMLVAENAFEWLEQRVQELLFVYMIKLPENCELTKQEKIMTKDHVGEENIWIDLENLKSYKCLPELIYDLPNMDKFKHFINNAERI